MLRDWLARRFHRAAAILGRPVPVSLHDARVLMETCDCGCGLSILYFESQGQEVMVSLNRHTASDLGDALVSQSFRSAEREERVAQDEE